MKLNLLFLSTVLGQQIFEEIGNGNVAKVKGKTVPVICFDSLMKIIGIRSFPGNF